MDPLLREHQIAMLRDAQPGSHADRLRSSLLFPNEATMKLLEREVALARTKHGPMRGPHEGYAVILEELDELWDEVKGQEHDRERMAKEALQVAATALRFIEDVCGPSPSDCP